MQHQQTVFSKKQLKEMHRRGWTGMGKRIHASIERNRQHRHRFLAGKRYAILIEVDVLGDVDPVLALIVTAPNVRAARSKAIDNYPGHIQRFLAWKELPLYPIDDEAVA